MWSLVAWRVSEGKVPGTLSTLKQKLKRVWSQIPDETLSAMREGHAREIAGSHQEEGLCTTKIIYIKRVFLFLFLF